MPEMNHTRYSVDKGTVSSFAMATTSNLMILHVLDDQRTISCEHNATGNVAHTVTLSLDSVPIYTTAHKM